MPTSNFLVKKISVEELSDDFSEIVVGNGFKIIKKNVSEDEVFIKAARGSKLKAYIIRRFVPYSNWMKMGQRCGCEARVTKRGANAAIEIKVIPYMELWNRKEIFLVTQGLGERWADNRLTKEKYGEIVAKLKNKYADRIKEVK